MKRGTVVLLHGSIKGMGREAECEILARRLPIPVDPRDPMPRLFTYTDCSVVEAPADLPEGEYLAQFEGYSLSVTLYRGLWLSRGPVARIETPVFCD